MFIELVVCVGSFVIQAAEGGDCDGAESDFRSAAELFSNFFSFLAFTGIIR